MFSKIKKHFITKRDIMDRLEAWEEYLCSADEYIDELSSRIKKLEEGKKSPKPSKAKVEAKKAEKIEKAKKESTIDKRIEKLLIRGYKLVSKKQVKGEWVAKLKA
mgnify:CR=1 FL=1